MMNDDIIPCLGQGEMSEDHFDLLVASTSIRSEPVIRALKEHLVDGLDKVVAVERNGIFFSQFSSRLSILEHTSYRISRMAKYYCQQQST